jgi:hypothetical protein
MASNLASDIIGNTNLKRFNFELIRNVSSAAGTALPIPAPTTPSSPPPVAGNTPPTNGGGASIASNDPCTGPNAGDICENNDKGEIIDPSARGGR